MAIFLEMVEKYLEIFIDDILVFILSLMLIRFEEANLVLN